MWINFILIELPAEDLNKKNPKKYVRLSVTFLVIHDGLALLFSYTDDVAKFKIEIPSKRAGKTLNFWYF